MPTVVIGPASDRNYQWGAEAQMDRRWLRLAQVQGDPNDLQVILLAPKQVEQLIAEYRKRYR